MAFQTVCGLAGMGMSVTPRPASASTMALMTAGAAPMVPASPMPFTPRGLVGDGVMVWPRVIGGTSLFGGVATIIGTVIGVFIPAVLQNGFIIIKVNPYWQLIAVGVVLVIAVAMDQWRRRGQNRR